MVRFSSHPNLQIFLELVFQVYFAISIGAYDGSVIEFKRGDEDDLLVIKSAKSLLVLEPILAYRREPTENEKDGWIKRTRERFNITLPWKEMVGCTNAKELG